MSDDGLLLPVSSQGAAAGPVAAKSMVGAAERMRRARRGAHNVVAASWTIQIEEDGYVPHPFFMPCELP